MIMLFLFYAYAYDIITCQAKLNVATDTKVGLNWKLL